MVTKDVIAQRKARLAARRADLSAEKQAELEKLLRKGATQSDEVEVIPRRPPDGPVYLSFAQQRLWFLDQLEPDSPIYNIPVAVRLDGALNLPALEQSINETVRRHESLRTNFGAQDGYPVQVIAPRLTLRIPLIDLTGLPEAEREPAARRLAVDEAERPFKLAEGALLRVTLLRLGEREHTLLLTIHHIVSDGWSLEVLIHEMGALYKAYTTAGPSPLPELPIQYADFAHWQRQQMRGERLESGLSYWRRQLQDSPPVLNLPTDRPHPAVMSYRGGNLFVSIGEQLTEGLRALSQREGVTLFTTLLASFQLLLARYSGQDDIAVGTPSAGRRLVESEGLIGLFINTLVMRTRLAGSPSVREVLGRVREVVLDAQMHQDVPFEKLVEELQPERTLSHAPLFQVMFVLQNVPKKALEEVEGLSSSEVYYHPGVEKFNLTLATVEEPHRLACSLNYNTDLFDRATMERMAGHWQQLLAAMVEAPDRAVWDIPLLSGAERRQAVSEWNDAATAYPKDKSLVELFEAQAGRRPDAVAVSFEGEQLNFAGLNRRANQLAHFLRSLGVGPEVLVGVCMERSPEMVVAILGVLKAGGAYVPLDPAYPKERLNFILEDARAPVLLTQRQLLTALPESGVRTVCLDDDQNGVSRHGTDNPARVLDADNPAYVIYTSGSTGRPKGVPVTHHNVVRLLEATQPWFHFDEHDVWTMFHSYAFDFSVWELYGALLYGGRVVVVPHWVTRSPEGFYELLRDEGVTVLNQTPSAFMQLARAEESAPPGPELSLRLVIFGGEALDLQTLKPWFDRHGDRRPELVNMYGITETTVHVTYRPLRAADAVGARGSVIGRPIPDLQVYLLDAHQQLVPAGVTGEMWVGGAGLARGYLGRPGLTAERFAPDPYSGRPGSRLYRSGDLARHRDGGELEYLGRADEQVKIRGHRIELGEVEAALSACPLVRHAVVMAREDAPGDKRLVAYVVAEGGGESTVEQLQRWLKERLPNYMLPSAVVVLDGLPLTAHGKVNRRALPEPGSARADQERSYVAPRTLVEELLAGIWEQVLGLERVGRADNFFWVGGHSLLATQVVSRVRETFQIELPVRSLFEAPTLAVLAESVEAEMRAGGAPSLPPLTRIGEAESLPLSFAQQRLWFLDQLTPGSNAYNLPAAVPLNIELNVPALEQALGEVVRRHETLRTTFAVVGGDLLQVVGAAEPMRLPVVDLGGLAEEARTVELDRLTGEEARRPFDLAKGPLLRVSLLRLGPREHVLLVTMHHVISDGWSMGVLMHEVEELYAAFVGGGASPLPELPVQYADYAQWQRQWLHGEVVEAELDYWRRQLAGAPTVLELPIDHPRPAVRRREGTHRPIVLPESLSQSLREFSRREGVTLFMTLMAGVQALLGRYTGQDDVLIGTPVAGRSHVETEGLIGFFVNMLVLRGDLRGAPTFREFLGRVRETALGAYAHQDLPFDKLVEELQPERSLGRNPLFQVIVAYQNAPAPSMKVAGLTLPQGSPGSADTKFDLEIYFWDTPEGIKGSFVYSTELFEPRTIERMADHFAGLLEKALAAPDASLASFTMMGPTEYRRVVEEWNETEADFPSAYCLHELFEQQAAQTPHAVALEWEESQVSYGELNRRADALARRLRAKGVGPEVFVGALLERSTEMIVALLGIVKAGGAYVPLNIADPVVRNNFILEDAGISILVTTRKLAEELPEHGGTVVCVDGAEDGGEDVAPGAEGVASGTATPDNLAYMMYTSGSTGTPKGVCITHRNVVKLIKGADYADLGAREVFLQFAPLSFDASTFEIWGALLNGARLVLFPSYAPTLSDLGDELVRSQITTLWLTAGLFHQMVDANLQGLGSVKQLLAGGEALSAGHVNKVLAELDGCRLINGYGPTETTTFACCYTVERGRHRTSVPIGRPISNTRVYLLNEEMQPAATGERGELYIGGEGLARGYLKRPGLTAEKFVADPFAREPGGRLYRTGDVARHLEGGEIEFLGRADNQVKVRGFRIELGEIEAALSEHPAVREAVVVAREDAPGDKRLVAYVVADGENVPGSEELKGHVRERLPEYMAPSVCVTLEALPLTANGKVDRRALPAPDRSLLRSERAFVAPQTELQQQLAEIWEEVLGIRPIGLKDDFFELGGHSLLVVRLIAQIEERIGKRIPMAALFQGSTVEYLDELLRKQTEAPSWSPLVPIQPHGSQRPLFFVHPAGGHVFCYADLARHLGADQPFYGLQARGSHKDQTPHTEIEAMAADYVDAVRAFQPSGPYMLGGWSVGAVVAFEMARQLQAQGEQTSLLVLVDAEAPQEDVAEYTFGILLGSFALDLGMPFEQLTVPWEEIAALPQAGQFNCIFSEAKIAGVIPPDMTLVEFRKNFDMFKTNAQMTRSYRAGAYQGRATLFSADKPLERITQAAPGEGAAGAGHADLQKSRNPLARWRAHRATQMNQQEQVKGWSQFATGGVEAHTVPGDHYSVVREPNVRVLAELLRDCIANTAQES